MKNLLSILKEKVDFKKQSTHYTGILIICFFAFFVNNQVIPADLMEARNLATAQEMVSERNFLTPTMNGELRLEKPPLPTWIAAGIETITPGNLILQRYAAGLMGTLMVIFLYLLTCRLTGNSTVGFMASLVLASCFSIIMMGRTATWDIYCHSFMLGAIYFLFIALKGEGAQWRNFILSGLFMGLSFLGKGPVSFYALLLPFLISYFIVYRPKMAGKKSALATLVLVCMIVSFWWMAYILIFHPEMALSVAHKESSSWLNHNVRPWYYYWQFPAEAGIWALFFVTAIIYSFVYKKELLKTENKLALIWLFSSLFLLSVIPEKKTRYLLPVLIPGAILIAFYFYRCMQELIRGKSKIVFRINAGIIALIFAVMPIALYIIFYRENQLSLSVLIFSAITCWCLSGGMFYSIYGKGGIKVPAVFTLIVLCMTMVESLCLIPIGHMFINEDRHSIRILRNDESVKNLPFYYDRKEGLRMELVYEANKIIRPIDVDDTDFIDTHTPFVFLSSYPLDSLFSDKNVRIEPVDKFDNNWQKADNRKYNRDLVKEVAIIRKK